MLVHWSVLLAFPFAWALKKDVVGALIVQGIFLVLMLAHELGHAFAARWFRLPVFSIRLYAIHGVCIHGPSRTKGEEIAIAWGGVAAQALLFLAALGLTKALSISSGVPRFLEPALEVLVPINLLIAFCNLLPIAPLDGSKAWRFIPLALRRIVARIKSASPGPRRSSNGQPEKGVALGASNWWSAQKVRSAYLTIRSSGPLRRATVT